MDSHHVAKHSQPFRLCNHCRSSLKNKEQTSKLHFENCIKRELLEAAMFQFIPSSFECSIINNFFPTKIRHHASSALNSTLTSIFIDNYWLNVKGLKLCK